MKKILSAILLTLMLLSFFGCEESKPIEIAEGDARTIVKHRISLAYLSECNYYNVPNFLA